MDRPPSQVFQKLNPSRNEFRLLYLQPADPSKQEQEQEHDSADIVGKLAIESLDSPPSYEAMSYVWGNRKNCVNVVVNGCDFPVTRTLYQALKRLLLQDRARILWVDAICINQGDLEERSQQVNQMRHIYQSASSIAAFLGDPYDGIEIALQYLALSAEDDSRHFQQGMGPHLSVGDLDVDSEELAIALVRLFHLPWWTRVWTVQEFLLARTVVFYCGHHVVSARILGQGASNLMNHGAVCCDPHLGKFSRKFLVYEGDAVSHNVWHGFNNFLGLWVWHRVPPEKQFLHWTFSLFRTRFSTDPRDKIYGLLGLAPGELDGILSLDYEASVEHVFETFTVEYIQYHKDLCLLGALGGERRLLNLPSFCPDWTIRPGDDPIDDETMMVQISNRMAVQSLYFASGISKATWRHIGPGMVAANGFVFDVVRDASPECFRRSWERRQQWAREVLALAAHVEIETLLRALCGGLAFCAETKNYELIRNSDDDLKDRLEKWWKWTLSGDSISSCRDKDVIHVEQAALKMSAGRSFVVTQKGYIGYADHHCVPGHVVSILGGGYAPFVLAPTSMRSSVKERMQYRVLGDAYIQGIMHGEALELAGKHVDDLGELILI